MRRQKRRLQVVTGLVGALVATTAVVVSAAAGTAPAARGVPYEAAEARAALATGPCVFGTPWAHNDVTYSVFAHTDDMSVSRQEAAIREAFDIWQGETPLRFAEVPSGGDLIVTFQSFGSLADLAPDRCRLRAACSSTTTSPGPTSPRISPRTTLFRFSPMRLVTRSGCVTSTIPPR